MDTLTEYTLTDTHTACRLKDTHTECTLRTLTEYTLTDTHTACRLKDTHTECTLRTHTLSRHLTLTAEVLLDLGAMYSWSPPPMELSRPGLERERSCLLGEVGGVTCSSLMESGDPVGRR